MVATWGWRQHHSPQPRLCRRDSGWEGPVGWKTTVVSLKCYVWLLNVLRLLNVELGLRGIRAKAISRETT